MSPWQLKSVLNVHMNLPLKFHQNRVSNSWDIAGIEFLWWVGCAKSFYGQTQHCVEVTQHSWLPKNHYEYLSRLGMGSFIILFLFGGYNKILFILNVPKILQRMHLGSLGKFILTLLHLGKTEKSSLDVYHCEKMSVNIKLASPLIYYSGWTSCSLVFKF